MAQNLSGDYLIESFGRKQGRPLSIEKQQLISDILPSHLLPIEQATALASLFPTDCKETWLEIGFGNGEHLVHQLQNNRDIAIIGGEVYIHGIAACLKSLRDDNDALQRLRIYKDDIRILLGILPEDSLDKAFILFPDPWPKKKQQKRRIIKQDLLEQLAKVLKPGAKLHIATDHHGYAQWIIAHIMHHPEFSWDANCEADWRTPPTHHIQTRYQQKNKAQTDYPIFINATRS